MYFEEIIYPIDCCISSCLICPSSIMCVKTIIPETMSNKLKQAIKYRLRFLHFCKNGIAKNESGILLTLIIVIASSGPTKVPGP